MNTLETTGYTIRTLVSLLHDAPPVASAFPEAEHDRPKNSRILEMYFNDLYKLFVAKLAKFESAPSLTTDDKQKLRSVLEELFNVKTLLVD